MNTKAKYYAFFDVDGTLIDSNTMRDFLRFYYLERFGWLGKIRYGLYQLIMKIHILRGKNREYLNRKYYIFLRNKKINLIETLGLAWYQRHVLAENKYIENVVNEVIEHQRLGGEIVFVSGSFDALIKPLALDMNVKYILATKLVTNGDRYTGQIAPPQTIGIGKTEAIREFLNLNHYDDYGNCYAYGDHVSDIHMLTLVGNPRVVSGDIKMEAHAIKYGWKIINRV